jgi:cytochrome c oxidase cbb3-type subunit 3
MFIPGITYPQPVSSVGTLEIILILVLTIIIVISILLILILIFTSNILSQLLNLERKRKSEEEASDFKPFPGFWSNLSRSLTRSTPIDEEASILMGHNYDGIRELNNHLPPWWKGLFYFTMLWGAIYLLTYHVFNVFPLSEEEYDREMARIEAIRKANQSLLTENIDENTVTYSDNPDVLASGSTIFKAQCVVCHADDGGGGIGPNLTDTYWLHGGSINNIFWVIKYGVPEKGMISWQNQLSPTDIRDVASYIKSLAGTTPANPKEPQGELYDEKAPITVPDKPDLAADTRPNIYTVSDTLDTIQIGRGLFSGSIRLNNGGPGCITCHHVEDDVLPKGALIAPDLTNVYSRLDGETIKKYATKPYHQTMIDAYKNMEVTMDEAELLLSFFEFVGTSTQHQEKRDKRAASFMDRLKKN